MTWRVVAASAIGTSHSLAGQTCQDSCLAYVDLSPGRQPLLCIFAADGAGSATYGGEGAELAMEASAAFFSKKYALPDFVLSQELAAECMMVVQKYIYDHSQKKEREPRDYACTFLGLLSSSQGTLLMQIGDGGIVVDVGNGLEVPISPMSGEYANMTNFVTDEDAIHLLASKFFHQTATKAAVFTDGVQRLALNIATNMAYEPFFAPFFKVMSTVSPQQEDQLQIALAQFLNSEAVNERTDDDKTLALAISVE